MLNVILLSVVTPNGITFGQKSKVNIPNIPNLIGCNEKRANQPLQLGATTFSIMTLSIMTLSIMTLSIMTRSITTLSIMGLLATLNINATQYNGK
jgi:hypothetical protein